MDGKQHHVLRSRVNSCNVPKKREHRRCHRQRPDEKRLGLRRTDFHPGISDILLMAKREMLHQSGIRSHMSPAADAVSSPMVFCDGIRRPFASTHYTKPLFATVSSHSGGRGHWPDRAQPRPFPSSPIRTIMTHSSHTALPQLWRSARCQILSISWRDTLPRDHIRHDLPPL